MGRRSLLFGTGICLLILALGRCGSGRYTSAEEQDNSLRELYARPSEQWPAPTLSPGVAHREIGPLSGDSIIPAAGRYAALEVADDRALRQLGKRLFFDPRLSASNQISCGSCHDPDLGWGDGRRRSFGHDRQRGLRNAPTLLNVGHWKTLFWDGRAESLEAQSLGPLQDHLEMNELLDSLGRELGRIPGYRGLFTKAYGVDSVTTPRISRALAAFQRSLRSRTSPFDQFVAGRYDALDDQELRGLHLFRTKARCLNCHNGPLFSDQQFHNQGSHLLGRPEEDLGRYAITGNWSDAGAFRTPTLRDIVFTGPYFHHGNIAELREILQMYNAGMPQIIPRGVAEEVERIPVHDPLLEPLGLTEGEIDDLLAFLHAISVRPRPIRIPEMVE
jgi:cytochrome c peroxidase